MIDIFCRKTLMTTNSPSLNENPANWRPLKSDQILDLEAAADLETQNLFINRRIRGSTAARGLPQPKNQTNQTYSYSLHRIMPLSSCPKLLEPIPKLNLYELIFSCVTVYITSTALKSIWQKHKKIYVSLFTCYCPLFWIVSEKRQRHCFFIHNYSNWTKSEIKKIVLTMKSQSVYKNEVHSSYVTVS